MAPSDTTEDAALLARWLDRRDEAALEALIARHRPMVEATCRRILRHGGDPEDAIQECFIALADEADRIHGSVGGWLRTVATHRALMQLRAQRRQRRQPLESAPPPAAAGGDPGVPDQLVDACLGELADQERDLIVRLFYLGESQADIARDEDVPRVYIHRRLQRALAQLRSAFRHRGVRVTVPQLILLLAGGDAALAGGAAGAHASTVAAGAAVLAIGAGLALWLPAPPHAGEDPSPPAVATTGPLATDAPAAATRPPSRSAMIAPGALAVTDVPWPTEAALAGGIPGAPPMPLHLAAELQAAIVPTTMPLDDLDRFTDHWHPITRSPAIRMQRITWPDGRESTCLRLDPPPGQRILVSPDFAPAPGAEMTYLIAPPDDPSRSWAMTRVRICVDREGRALSRIDYFLAHGPGVSDQLASRVDQRWKPAGIGWRVLTSTDRPALIFAIACRVFDRSEADAVIAAPER